MRKRRPDNFVLVTLDYYGIFGEHFFKEYLNEVPERNEKGTEIRCLRLLFLAYLKKKKRGQKRRGKKAGGG